MEVNSRSFKPSYRPLVLLLWLFTTLGVLGGLVASSGLPLRSVAVLGASLACLVLSLPVALALAELSRIVISPQGLRAPDYAGRRYLVEWSKIMFVRPTKVLGLKYLRVFSRDGGPVLWLPLFLTDMPGFRAALIRHATAGTPLVEHFGRNAGA
jgi:hypothetical protein